MSIIWQLFVETSTGPQAIAITRSEAFCNLMVRMLEAIDQWSQCIAVIPGVAS